MRRVFLLFLLLLTGFAANAQNAAGIRRDASYLSAEGRAPTLHAADSAALAGLAAKVTVQAGLPATVGATYMEDLRNASQRIVEGQYTVLRYLEATRIGDVFAPRRERVNHLIQQAEQTGEAQYYSLAYTLARSLPAYPADLLESLRQRSSGSWTMQDFVSREADAVLAALEPRPAAPKVSASSSRPRREPEIEHITVQDTVTVERDLAHIEIEHTFSRRDTLVIVPGVRSEGTTTVPLQKVKPVRQLPVHGFFLAQISPLPDLSYGAALGLGGQRWGGYVRFGSNLRKVSPAYDCSSDGTTDFGVIWTSGERAVSRLSITGGAWVACTDWLKCYAGAGYGRRTVCWQDTQSAWARVTDYSAAGLTLDAGVIFDLGRFSLSAGGEAIAFRQFALMLGAGFNF